MWYSILFVITSSFASILVQKLYFVIPSTLTLLVTSIIATLYFNGINLGHLRSMHAHCWQHKSLWLSIMAIILVMWYSTMTGPGMIGASLYRFLYFAWLGMLGFWFLAFKKPTINRQSLLCGLFVVVLLAGLLGDYFWRHAWSMHELIGIALPLVGGTASFVYFKQSEALTKRTQLTATQVLAIRFYLTIVVLLLLVPTHHSIALLTPMHLLILAVVAVFSLIIPLYCMQKALEKIGSERNAILISLAPIVTAFLEEAAFHDVRFQYLIVYGLYTAMLIAVYVWKISQGKQRLDS